MLSLLPAYHGEVVADIPIDRQLKMIRRFSGMIRRFFSVSLINLFEQETVSSSDENFAIFFKLKVTKSC